jgi:hypothetical protein
MKVYLLLLAVMLSGCTSKWIPAAGKSDYTLQEAEEICYTEALRKLPIKNEIATETTYERPNLICDDEDNKKNKKKAHKKCYIDSYGWQLQGQKTRSYVLDVKEAAIKWSAAPDMTPQTVLYRRPVAQFSNFQPKIVSSWLILALFQANFLISGRSRLCPYQLVNSNQVRQGE